MPITYTDINNDSVITNKELLANKDTDGTLAANSDTKYPSQKATKTYADTKAPLASPALTGTPTAPTASSITNTTQVATTAFVQTVFTSANVASKVFNYTNFS